MCIGSVIKLKKMNKIIGILGLVTFVLCGTFCTSKKVIKLNSEVDVSPVLGKWELQAIKLSPQDEIIIPTKAYWVNFSMDTYEAYQEEIFAFKKEANTCRSQFKLLKNKKIEIKAPFACTKMCCDRDISDQLTYGDVTNYSIQNNKLTLIAPNRKFEFIKTEKTNK